jgi:hypothetical protein
MEDCMIEAANEKEVDLNELAQTAGLRFPVKVSAELSELSHCFWCLLFLLLLVLVLALLLAFC